MATKTINLTDGAYARLHALKREGESFSDVVNRITGKFGLVDIVGIIGEAEAEAMREAKASISRRMRRGINKRALR